MPPRDLQAQRQIWIVLVLSALIVAVLLGHFILLGAVAVVGYIGYLLLSRRYRTIREAIEHLMPEGSDECICAVHLRIVQNDAVTGGDEGWLRVEDGCLSFNGLRTALCWAGSTWLFCPVRLG